MTVDYKNGLDLRRALTNSPPYGRGPVKINCPYHDDQIASAAVYPDGFHCHSCGANGGPLQFLATHHGLDLATDAAAVHATADKLAALGPAEERAAPKPVSVDLLAKVEGWRNPPNWDKAREYFTSRGFSQGTITRSGLGHTGRAYVLPLYDRFGHLFSVKYRRDDALDPNAPKYWTHPGTGRTATYYPPLRDWSRFPGAVVLCEGELDALLLAQQGVPAVSVNNGVNAVAAMLPELLERHSGLVLCLDNDGPGQAVDDELRQQYGGLGSVASVSWVGTAKDVGEAFSAGCGDRLLEALRNAYRRIVATQGRDNHGRASAASGRHSTDHRPKQ